MLARSADDEYSVDTSSRFPRTLGNSPISITGLTTRKGCVPLVGSKKKNQSLYPVLISFFLQGEISRTFGSTDKPTLKRGVSFFLNKFLKMILHFTVPGVCNPLTLRSPFSPSATPSCHAGTLKTIANPASIGRVMSSRKRPTQGGDETRFRIGFYSRWVGSSISLKDSETLESKRRRGSDKEKSMEHYNFYQESVGDGDGFKNRVILRDTGRRFKVPYLTQKRSMRQRKMALWWINDWETEVHHNKGVKRWLFFYYKICTKYSEGFVTVHGVCRFRESSTRSMHYSSGRRKKN